jgi:hypothetical protein
MKNVCRTASLTAMLVLLLIAPAILKAQTSRAPGVTLRPLDAGMVDNALRSSNGKTRATIKFVNQRTRAVDISWITYAGHRVLYYRGLAVNSTWTADTFLTHPWLVIASDSGGTTTSGTGVRLGGFEALTTNGDTAIITNLN